TPCRRFPGRPCRAPFSLRRASPRVVRGRLRPESGNSKRAASNPYAPAPREVSVEKLETHSLPESAYRPLNPGEVYRPVVPASAQLPEATWRSVLWGLFLCGIFTAASAYSGLKVGQVMEAAIPISILAIGLARAYRRRSSLLENVIITGIGGVSGSVV